MNPFKNPQTLDILLNTLQLELCSQWMFLSETIYCSLVHTVSLSSGCSVELPGMLYHILKLKWVEDGHRQKNCNMQESHSNPENKK